MRILYIVTAFPRSSVDVITPWLSETIERLRGRGVEVEVLAPSYRGLGRHMHGGTAVHRFRYAPARLETLTHDQTTPDRLRERPAYAALLPAYLAAGTAAAVRLARSGRFDAIHAFWPLPHGIFALAARRAAGIPVISTFFGVELTWVRRQLPFLAPLIKWIARGSDAVTAISSATQGELAAIAPGVPVRTIPFGATVSPSAPGGALPRSEVGHGFRLLFVGRLVERKGLSVLLQALPRLRERGVTLTVVGDGPLKAQLEREVEQLGVVDLVEFTGSIPADELSRRFSSCDAFVLPAVQDSKGDVEGLGVVLLEAIEYGRPVIASDSGGIPDIVLHEETGLLVPPGNSGALADAILRLQADPELAQRLAAAARAHVREHFSWDHIIDHLVALYAQVAPAAVAGRSDRLADA